ncbi:ankyrin, partial [Morchella conica CCBAS932]
MEVGASIVGLLSAGASIAIAINDFVTSCNNAPLFAQSILHETLEFSYALEKLQHLVVGPQATSLDQSRTSMIDVNHLSLTLVGCVCTFSQLEKEIQRMKLSGKFGILDRVKWSFIERDVCSIIQRIQNHKMSLMLILTILNGSATEAASSRESLNTHLSRTISYTPSSMPIDDDSSSVTSNSSLSQKLYRHAFESTLFVSRPYIRGRRFDDAQSAFSIATSQRPKGWWSLYTGKSNDSVLSLPVSVTTISGTSLTEIPSICNLSLPVPPDALLNSLPNPFKPGDPGDPPPPRPSGSTDRDRLTPRNDTYHLVSFRPFLLKAARQGLNTTVTMLLDNTADMSIQRTQRHLDDALHVAMAHGHEEVAQILLERGARISIEPTSVSSGAHGKEKKIDDTPPRQTAHMTKLLRVAIVAGEIDNVALQLDNGAAIEDVDHNGNTTLHLALGITRKDNKDKIIKLLLHRGAAADTRNKQGLTPLHLAAKGGHNDAMKLLLDRGAAIDARAPGEMTALHLAAEYGDKKPAELLLDRGAAIDARTDARLSKTTALHLAAGRGHKNLVELLLDRGADIDAIDNQHNTALHRAQAG